ncbi:MAG: hypothetical protein JWQ34_1890 [Mucilaginibacter sp.]|uniref:hypothetical protein n=1 Tax=Mucilaginibacter sp. TaxID=1882438 RepID=UPI00262943C5|nr:hypothetical protein [Mucilaginibacter sp.]MDB5003665.1 hypothetical protein [Mucilaginibacter sp.]
MRNLIIITLLFFGTSITCLAQQGKLNKDTSAFAKSPLYIIKFKNQTFKHLSTPMMSLLPQADIQEMEVLSGKKADSLYHGEGKNGVIIITVNKEVTTFTKDALFKKYNIKKTYKDLPLYIDSALTYKADNNMFVIDHIKTITVAKDNETGKKYISIITDVVKFKPDQMLPIFVVQVVK